jgi:hypothetical protein
MNLEEEEYVTTPRFSIRAATSIGYDLFDSAWPYLVGRGGMLVLGIVAMLVAIAFSWSWLTAVRIAPILLATLPCLAMCGLGLCMNRLLCRAGGVDPSPQATTEPTPQDAPAGGPAGL